MSRERFIDPGFFISESVATLSIGARLTLVGLIATADDHGRGKISPKSVQMRLYPAGGAKEDEIANWIEEITKSKIIRTYMVDGISYYDLPNWSKYQRIKYISHSKIPPFPDDLPRSCRILGKSSRNPEQGGEGRGGVGR